MLPSQHLPYYKPSGRTYSLQLLCFCVGTTCTCIQIMHVSVMREISGHMYSGCSNIKKYIHLYFHLIDVNIIF